MVRKLENKKAINLNNNKTNENGDIILDRFIPDIDYCVMHQDLNKYDWIWSIGRNYKTGEILASTTGKFYENDEYECLWLR